MNIKEFSKYTFNKDGSIIGPSGKTLSYHTCKKGYCRANLKNDAGKKRTYLVHRLIAFAFLPNPERKPQINHKDGDKSNNSVANLEWCSNLENNQHASRHALHKRGAERPNSKLCYEKVRELKGLRKAGWNFYQLGKRFGIAYQTAHKICNGKSYKYA